MIRKNSTCERVAQSIASRIAALQLDLRGLHVLTEAATGAYAVTPVVAAAAAGASVTALTKSTRYGSVDDVCRQVLSLAAELNLADQIQIVETLTAAEPVRDELMQRLLDRVLRSPLPNSLCASVRSVCLPLVPNTSREEQDRVVTGLRQMIAESAARLT